MFISSPYRQALVELKEKRYHNLIKLCTREIDQESGGDDSGSESRVAEARLLRASMYLLRGESDKAMHDFDTLLKMKDVSKKVWKRLFLAVGVCQHDVFVVPVHVSRWLVVTLVEQVAHFTLRSFMFSLVRFLQCARSCLPSSLQCARSCLPRSLQCARSCLRRSLQCARSCLPDSLQCAHQARQPHHADGQRGGSVERLCGGRA